MSSGAFNQKQLRLTVKNLLKEKTSKDTEEDYLGCIEMLESILRTGEIGSTELRDIILEAIEEFKVHVNLGIIIKGSWSPIDCHLAARHDIAAGNFISGKQFPVFTKSPAAVILKEFWPTQLPKDCIWDKDSRSVIHLRAYYMRNLDELLGITSAEIKRLDLADVFRRLLNGVV